MSQELLGQLFSVLCAAFWAGAVVLFTKAGEKVAPLGLNVFKNLLAFLLFVPTLVVMGEPLLPRLTGWSYLVLAVSGFLGITVADTLFLGCLNRVGANLTALIDCFYIPFVMLLAFCFFGERIGAATLGGGALITLAIVVSTTGSGRARMPAGRLAAGILMGMGSMLMMAVAVIILKKPIAGHPAVFDAVPLLWLTAFRILVALVTLCLWALARGDRARVFAWLLPSREWRIMAPAAVLGTYLAMLIWLVGLKLVTNVSTAAVLNQLTIIFVLILSALFLGDRITLRKAAAVVLAVAGAVVTVLWG